MIDLKIEDIMKLLNASKQDVEKLIQSGQIPAYKIDGKYHFNRAEIKEWVLESNVPVTKKILEIDLSREGISLVSLINRGGVFYNVKGSSEREVIKNAVQYIPIPHDLTREKLIYTLLLREEMMTTAVGMGIALPHPREPIITRPENESVSVCFLEKAIDFHALDGKPVSTLFIILSSDQVRHLEVLSRISYLCQQDDFIDLLKQKVSIDKILDYIIIKELEWNE